MIAQSAQEVSVFAALPDGPFSVVLADPPWAYVAHTTDPSRRIENHYATLDYRVIAQLPVPGVLARSAALFLWSPLCKVAEAISVLEAWGFRYKSQWAWVKPSITMGYYGRNRHEVVLIGTRGSGMARRGYQASSVFYAPRGAHSEKPEEVHLRLEAMYPDLTKLELFARRHRPGWTVWGDAVAQADDPVGTAV
jgi:N6-adenosine-specific RNA methylase IME4